MAGTHDQTTRGKALKQQLQVQRERVAKPKARQARQGRQRKEEEEQTTNNSTTRQAEEEEQPNKHTKKGDVPPWGPHILRPRAGQELQRLALHVLVGVSALGKRKGRGVVSRAARPPGV